MMIGNYLVDIVYYNFSWLCIWQHLHMLMMFNHTLWWPSFAFDITIATIIEWGGKMRVKVLVLRDVGSLLMQAILSPFTIDSGMFLLLCLMSTNWFALTRCCHILTQLEFVCNRMLSFGTKLFVFSKVCCITNCRKINAISWTRSWFLFPPVIFKWCCTSTIMSQSLSSLQLSLP